MDTEIKFPYQVRDFRTHNVLAGLDEWGSHLQVPKDGTIARFIEDYKALENLDMGQAVEIFDPEQNKVTEFVIVHNFRPMVVSPELESSIYYVSLFNVSNIEMLEIVHQLHEKEHKIDTI